MEIGNQCIYRLEAIAGVDEDLGIVVHGVDDAVIIRCAFQHTAGGGANRYDTAAVFAGVVDDLGAFLAHREVFAVHQMLVDALYLYGTEGTQSHVEHHRSNLHALGLDLLQQFGGEVETCRRGSGRAALVGIDSLILIVIRKRLGDVGGKRHFADAIQDGVNVTLGFIVGKVENTVTAVHYVYYLCTEQAVPEYNGSADFGASAGTGQGFPSIQLDLTEEEHLHINAGIGLFTDHTGRDYLGIVDDQHVAGT